VRQSIPESRGWRRESEKRERDSLTDRIVKRAIYIQAKGRVKWCDITAAMVDEKRNLILQKRNSGPRPKKTKKPFKGICSGCGKEFESKHKRARCSRECDLEYGRRESFRTNSEKKETKPRECKECGEVFIPEYGNKRRFFCSDECLKRSARRIRRHKERAKLRLVKVETVDPIRVFIRDGWRCQLCGKKLNRKHRGTYRHDAPELDHIVPLSRGGEHSYLNTQCACRKCNAEKKGEIRGRLRLFG
jgi:5-methylcytosine-specific restriction endonuclease McrA